MADNQDTSDKKTTPKKVTTQNPPTLSGRDAREEKSRKTLIITVVVLTVVALGLIGTMGYLAMSKPAEEVSGRKSGMHGMRLIGHSYDGSGRYISTEVTNDSVTTTVYNYKRGVVVAVNKDSVEIAGGGKRTTIKTNADTVYTDETKPAVNDTVIVTGTTTDGKITATEITVRN